VPDAGHKILINRSLADPDVHSVALTTEEEGVALLAGADLGGERGVLLMQSSGVGNCINMLSLTNGGRFPFLTLVSMRGDFGEANAWQYPMGQATVPVLEAMGVLCLRADSPAEAVATVSAALAMVSRPGARSRSCSPRNCSAPSAFKGRTDMPVHPASSGLANAIAASFVLERREAIPALLGRHEDFLIVAGLAGTSRDLAALTSNGAHAYIMTGAMGGACMIGLGLALARPDRRVLVVTGDGELLMNVGALATIAVMNPPNLSIVCVDNGHYGETGYQKSHTSLGTDLEKIAAGAGIKLTRTIEQEVDIAAGARLIREGNATSFVLLRVKPTEPPNYGRLLDPAGGRIRFRAALLKE
jgi:phosphonopyruvate decarboxylase